MNPANGNIEHRRFRPKANAVPQSRGAMSRRKDEEDRGPRRLYLSTDCYSSAISNEDVVENIHSHRRIRLVMRRSLLSPSRVIVTVLSTGA